MKKKSETITTSIWQEVASADNPFVAQSIHVHGYNVFSDLLGNISWVEYLYLLFKGEPPSAEQTKIFELLTVALANPGPRDLSVRAAMNGGVGGSTAAASLMSALAVGAGQHLGGREIFTIVLGWEECGCNMSLWTQWLRNDPSDNTVWPKNDSIPGFDPITKQCAPPVKQLLEQLSNKHNLATINWLIQHQAQLEQHVGYALSLVGVFGTLFHALDFDAEEAEMLYLLLRLPGAAVHSLEQKRLGWKTYPFWPDGIIYREPTSEK